MYKDALLYGTAKDFDVPNIEKLLTIPNPAYVSKARFGSMEWGEVPEKELCLMEVLEDGTFRIPRNMPQHAEKFFKRKHVENENTSGYAPALDYIFTGTLRDYQRDFVATIEFSTHDDLTIVMPCGTGKTIIGAYITAERNCRTLILVPTRAIAIQWLNTFKSFTNLGENTFIATPEKLAKIDLEICEVMIISFDLFGERLDMFTDEFFEQWGHVILDEAHRVAAPTYQPILSQINCLYRTALTATFRRSDNMHNILIYHFGKMFTLNYTAQKATVVPVPTGVTCTYVFSLKNILGGKLNRERNTKWLFEFLNTEGIEFRHLTDDIVEFDLVLALTTIQGYIGKVNRGSIEPKKEVYYLELDRVIKSIKRLNETSVISLIDTAFANSVKRNRFLLQIVRECIDAGRCVLFLSKRKEPLKRYNELFLRLGYKSGIIVSETQKKEDYMRYVREEAVIIFGIYQIAKEGLDIPRTDTLVMHHPIKDAEQPIGRITRLMDDKHIPLVIWPFDGYRPYQMMFHAMKKICKDKIVVMPTTTKKLLRKLLKE